MPTLLPGSIPSGLTLIGRGMAISGMIVSAGEAFMPRIGLLSSHGAPTGLQPPTYPFR